MLGSARADMQPSGLAIGILVLHVAATLQLTYASDTDSLWRQPSAASRLSCTTGSCRSRLVRRREAGSSPWRTAGQPLALLRRPFGRPYWPVCPEGPERLSCFNRFMESLVKALRAPRRYVDGNLQVQHGGIPAADSILQGHDDDDLRRDATSESAVAVTSADRLKRAMARSVSVPNWYPCPASVDRPACFDRIVRMYLMSTARQQRRSHAGDSPAVARTDERPRNAAATSSMTSSGRWPSPLKRSATASVPSDEKIGCDGEKCAWKSQLDSVGGEDDDVDLAEEATAAAVDEKADHADGDEADRSGGVADMSVTVVDDGDDVGAAEPDEPSSSTGDVTMRRAVKKAALSSAELCAGIAGDEKVRCFDQYIQNFARLIASSGNKFIGR